jgi:hypothetical protein
MSLFRIAVLSLLIALLAGSALAQTVPKVDASTKPIRIDRVIDNHENAIVALRAACQTQACEEVAKAGEKMIAEARLKRINKTMTKEEAYAYIAASKKHLAAIAHVLLNNAEGSSRLERRFLRSRHLSRWSETSPGAGDALLDLRPSV